MQNTNPIPLMADSLTTNVVTFSMTGQILSPETGKNGENGENGENSGSEIVVDHDFLVMLEKEKDYLITDDYIKKLKDGVMDSNIRSDSIDWMHRANDYFIFDKNCFLLAINYFDRFLSVHTLSRDQAWSMQLLAVACLSIAYKMEGFQLPSIVNIQVKEPRYIFQAKNIKKMELLVLSTLGWKMQPCTPNTFVQNFIKMINNDANYAVTVVPLTESAKKIIVDTIKDVDFLEYKPSEIACAVALAVSGDRGTIDLVKAMPNIKHVDKGRVLRCLQTLDEIIMNSLSTTATISLSSSDDFSNSSTLSPDNVLDVDCLSYKSDTEEEVSVNSNTTEDYDSVDSKRRRLD